MGTPISERPKDVKSRDTFGHWELDSMVSSRGESKAALLLINPSGEIPVQLKFAVKTKN
jgi:IS30 family transposase